MYLVLFFDQCAYEFNPSLHPSRAEDERAYRALLREFKVKPLSEGGLCDDYGEAPHVYKIACDGKVGEEINFDLTTE
jgi:hypothetical protein